MSHRLQVNTGDSNNLDQEKQKSYVTKLIVRLVVGKSSNVVWPNVFLMKPLVGCGCHDNEWRSSSISSARIRNQKSTKEKDSFKETRMLLFWNSVPRLVTSVTLIYAPPQERQMTIEQHHHRRGSRLICELIRSMIIGGCKRPVWKEHCEAIINQSTRLLSRSSTT